MFNFLSKNKKEVKSNIIDLLNSHQHPICIPMNELKLNKENDLIWLNPNDQTSFNSGWYSEQDLIDWSNGIGNVIKGNDDREKMIFWQYANFIKEHKHGWMLLYSFKHFNLLDETYGNKALFEKYCENPLKITKSNKSEIISKLFGCVVKTIEMDIYNDEINNKLVNEYLWGIKYTLFNLGVGYIGASNTPEEINNLSWISDIAIAKAYYNYLIKQNVVMPDFKFILDYGKKH
jgi:hypothetical protein